MSFFILGKKPKLTLAAKVYSILNIDEVASLVKLQVKENKFLTKNVLKKDKKNCYM